MEYTVNLKLTNREAELLKAFCGEMNKNILKNVLEGYSQKDIDDTDNLISDIYHTLGSND